MAGDWKDNRKIQFAVGATVIFLFLRWLFTGDLLMAVQAAQPPAEGETKSVTLLAVLWPMLVEAVIIVGVSAIAFGLKIWSFIVDLIDNARGVTNSDISPETKTAAPIESRDGLLNGLARAVATNDAASETKFKTQIRKPYAIAELNAALDDGDFATVEARLAEIKALAKGGAA